MRPPAIAAPAESTSPAMTCASNPPTGKPSRIATGHAQRTARRSRCSTGASGAGTVRDEKMADILARVHVLSTHGQRTALASKPSSSARNSRRIREIVSRSAWPSGAVPNFAALSTSVAASATSAPALGDDRERRSPILRVRLAAHETGALEAVDQVGDARRVHLQPRADLPERQRPAPADAQDHERLVARERQVVRLQQEVEARHQDLLDAHDRGDRAHRRRRRAAPVLDPLPAGLGDGVERRVACGSQAGHTQ